MYRENRVALHSLGDRHRALLYGAVALGVFASAARARMWERGLGELAWFVLVGAGRLRADGGLPPLAQRTERAPAARSYPRMGWRPPRQ